MLKVTDAQLDELEQQYPGFRDMVRRYEEQGIPACRKCGSSDTAVVGCGIVGRSINLAGATTKYKLLGNGPAPAKFFCNACEKFFGGRSEARGATMACGSSLTIERVMQFTERFLGRPMTEDDWKAAREKLPDLPER